MAEITPQIHQHLTANARIRKRDILISNFLGGLAWGFGTVIGASVVVAIIGAILKHFGIFDFLGMMFSQFGISNTDIPPVPQLYR